MALCSIGPIRRGTGFDSELIDELLGSQVAPSVVLMNPPYSHGIERGHDGRTGARHLRSAWKRLLPGGRLVAVMPEWFDLPRFLNGIAGPVTLRLNAAIERGFIKHGTSITTRLLVLDKVDHGDMPVIAKPVSFAELCSLVDGLPSRMQVTDEPVIAAKALVPLRLVAPGRKPSPLQVRSVAAPPAIKPLAYQPLEAPAPIAQQVGHYLPYRPSRIAIEGALDHPTPLVESIAMGSITAPVPVAVPQLPSNLIATGMLSAAQAETLIYAASAHSRDLAGRFEPEDKGCALKASADGRAYRMGYFLGDGTGAGKGRQVAAVILDRWVRGERRHIWISKNEALLEDARRDWTALGGLPIDVQPLGQWKLGISARVWA